MVVEREVWIGELYNRKPRYVDEVRELLSMGKDYVEGVIEAWLKRKTIDYDDLEFVPSRMGVEVYVDGEYETFWRNKVVEIAYYFLQVGDSSLKESKKKSKDQKPSDEDQVDVDVVINVDKPKQKREGRIVLDEEILEDD